MRANLLLALLVSSLLVAWSPRYWPVTLLHAGMFGLALGWLLASVIRPLEVRWNRLYLPVGVAALWGLLQLGLHSTAYAFATSRAVLYWSANAVAMFLAAQFLVERRIRRNFLAGLCYAVGFIAIIGILQYFTSPYRIYWAFDIPQHVRAIGPFVYRNQFAAVVELVLPIALYRVMQGRRRRWVFAVLAAVMFAVTVATASRAGTILVASEMVAVFLLGWHRGLMSARAFVLLAGRVAGMAIVFTLVVGFHDVWSRFQQSNPYALRGKLTQSTLRMIASRPLLGYGLGTWQTVYPEFATFDNSLFANEAHNDWAQWTAEGGIPFGLALAAVAVGAALLAWRNIWGVGVVFVFLHSLIDYPAREPAIGAVLFVLIGAMISANVDNKEEDEPELSHFAASHRGHGVGMRPAAATFRTVAAAFARPIAGGRA